jgi:hypothetical protein
VQRFEVAYVRKGERDVEKRFCGEGEIKETLPLLLDRLWQDTTTAL